MWLFWANFWNIGTHLRDPCLLSEEGVPLMSGIAQCQQKSSPKNLHKIQSRYGIYSLLIRITQHFIYYGHTIPTIIPETRRPETNSAYPYTQVMNTTGVTLAYVCC